MKASLGIQVNDLTQPPSVASFMIMTTINRRTGTPNAESYPCTDAETCYFTVYYSPLVSPDHL